MSRGAFRATVEERPTSAWMLVLVASATLWITEQLEPWVIGVEVAAILFSLWRRRDPHPWQSHPIALNVFMFGIAGTTIRLALAGNPATISLAHFAALTQGLQLLDSRPRKSEYLLVALALFQVILASNLTDSLLFPPLLAVFLVSAVWTLMVHTLRSEAIEAGDHGAATRALTPGLRRMTVIASVASIALSLVLFAFLPRMRTSMVRGGLGSGVAVSGFSNRVELGSIGRIRSDPTVVLRVETLEGRRPEPEDAYWRGLAFDHFDGRRWSITPPNRGHRPGSVKFGIDFGPGRDDADLAQRVVREPVSGGVLFGAGHPRHVAGALLRLESDVNGGLYDPLQSEQRVRYTIRTASLQTSDLRLNEDVAEAPERRGARYLVLPGLSPEIEEMAGTITAGLETDAEQARALERHLRREGRYTDTPPPLDEQAAPIEQFLLGELAGHCEYFASAMVVLARSVGLPARLVNGFAGGRVNPLGGFVELARSDAHAWVEVHYRDAGWVRYDPTPPDMRLRSLAAMSVSEHFAALVSTVELWWFQRIVDFDSSDQIAALKSAFLAWRKWRSPSQEGSAGGRERRKASRWALDETLGRSGIALAVALGLAAELVRRRRRSTTRTLPAAYARALRLLAGRGLERAPSSTARAFARSARDTLPARAARAFAELTEIYLGERFGSRRAEGADRALAMLEQELRGAGASPAS